MILTIEKQNTKFQAWIESLRRQAQLTKTTEEMYAKIKSMPIPKGLIFGCGGHHVWLTDSQYRSDRIAIITEN